MSQAMSRNDQLKMRLRAGRPLGEYLGKEAADRIEALEAALRRTEDHMRGFAEISPLDRTAETEAIIYCNAKLLQGE